MNYPSPAIVAQTAVRRLPRVALLLFCLAYLLPGFIGRDAWKSADAAALGYMAELAQGTASWWQPTLMGQAAQPPAWLPYWLGAWALGWAPSGWAGDAVVRLPFVLLLALALAGTWYGTYHLARSPRAQPVAFAFGGEAHPKDYARALADGALLALISCLGLAQLAHETTPALAQLGGAGVLFAGLCALPYRPLLAGGAFVWGTLVLGLSGAPGMALLWGAGGLALRTWELLRAPLLEDEAETQPWPKGLEVLLLALWLLGLGTLVVWAGLWQWSAFEQALRQWWEHARHVQAHGELLLWFTWPAWPLACWTVWRWRQQLRSPYVGRHVWLPLGWVLSGAVWALGTAMPDRALLLVLPALAALAAFALPTLRRQVAALVDWFTLLFFSGCAVVIWVVWLAMHTGFPAQPAANVLRLAPGFEARFSLLALLLAGAATLLWAWLVAWRIGRHRTVIWKSLVLPAAGAALCWLLLMTLWLPLLNYAQSYTALVERTRLAMQPAGCVEVVGLGQGKIAAFQWYAHVQLRPASTPPQCPWLVAEPLEDMSTPPGVDARWWVLSSALSHPADGNETVLLFRRR